MKLERILERRYGGKSLEAGGTARGFRSSPAPALRKLFDSGVFEGAKKVIDYGAGSGRNADYLRANGLKVYAYDPYNGNPDADGWEGVTTKQPKGKFDVGFTSFVLNVIPESEEKKIISSLKRLCKQSFHIVRNLDVFIMAKKALARRDPYVTKFFMESFADEEEAAMLEDGTITDEVIMDFCQHGFETSAGFQRIPMPEESGELTLVRRTQGFKVYKA